LKCGGCGFKSWSLKIRLQTFEQRTDWALMWRTPVRRTGSVFQPASSAIERAMKADELERLRKIEQRLDPTSSPRGLGHSDVDKNAI
jgi:hypothetical protein